MKKTLLKIRSILSMMLTTTAGVTFILSVCCLDGAPIPCTLLALVSMLWLYFRARANTKKYGSVEGDVL